MKDFAPLDHVLPSGQVWIFEHANGLALGFRFELRQVRCLRCAVLHGAVVGEPALYKRNLQGGDSAVSDEPHLSTDALVAANLAEQGTHRLANQSAEQQYTDLRHVHKHELTIL